MNANGKVVSFPYWDGASVLECFSHTGSFTLNACKFGAKKVTCLDISEHAIESARTNVALNGFEERVEFVVADAFEYLRTQVKGLDERKVRANAGSGKAKVDTSKPVADRWTDLGCGHSRSSCFRKNEERCRRRLPRI